MSENENGRDILEQLGTETGQMEGMYLTFALGEEGYGVEIKYVIQIMEMKGREITPMPEMPPHYKGIINWRGFIIPVVNMRVRFSIPECEYNDRTCIIIISINGVQTGLIVDEISEVVSIEPDMISSPPNLREASGDNEFIVGVARMRTNTGAENVKILIDCQKLFPEGEQVSLPQGM